MGWFKRDRRQAVSAREIADTLFQVLVEDELDVGHPKRFNVPSPLWPPFREKMRRYREAGTLMLLGVQAQQEAAYAEVLRAYEALILPSTPTPAGLRKLDGLKAAMRDLGALLQPEGERRQLSWSMAWLDGIGHIEANAAVLTLFAIYWMDFSGAVAGSLATLRPR